jgi:beta-galactosidase
MVRLWTWEAFAHGAEVVSYFRWRQAPFGQEQLHAGLHLPDGTPDVGAAEASRVAAELKTLSPTPLEPASVALIFDYESQWLLDIQPQGAGFDYLRLVFEWYGALRRLGVDIDVVPKATNLDGYRAVVIPTLPIVTDDFVERLETYQGDLLIGPRSGSKTGSFQIPDELPPGRLQRLLPLRIIRVESLRPGVQETVDYAGRQLSVCRWREWVESDLEPLARFNDGRGALYEHGRRRYLAGWPEKDLLDAVVAALCQSAGIATVVLDDGLRLRRRGETQFAFNYGPGSARIPAPDGTELLLGERRIAPGDVAVWYRVGA